MEIFTLSDSAPSLSKHRSIKPTPPSPSELSPAPKIPSAPVITALKPALRDKNRVNIFIDGDFAFSLDLAQVVDFKLKLGTPISPADRKKYESASELGKLYNSTLEWVFVRPRSEKETHDHLVQKLRRRELENKKCESNRAKSESDPAFRALAREKHLKTRPAPLFSEEDINTVISRLKQKGYLDDKKFAEYYIENRNLKKGISRRQLSLELQKKGISSELISDLLTASSRSEEEEIKKIIEKKYRKKTSDQLLRYLVSKGFPYDLSKSLLSNFYPDS